MERFIHNSPSNFELAGKRSAHEIKALVSNVAQILTKEAEAGRNKLGRNIDETRNGTHGQEYFADGKIAYLPPRGKAIFIGDTHGDSLSTEAIVKQVDFIKTMEAEKKDTTLVFLGDYSDRGNNDVRNLEIVLALKETYPQNVILLKGNHEEYKISKYHGLFESFRSRFPEDDESIFDEYHNLLNLFPNIVITGNGIVAVHGGIPTDEVKDLFTLRDNEDLFKQIRWNDPYQINGKISIHHWGVQLFGPDNFEKFMNSIGGKVMVRSHQDPKDGHEYFFDSRLVTIFSNGGGSTESHYPTVQPKILRAYLANPIRQITPLNIIDVKLS